MPGRALRPLSLGEILDVSFGVYRELFAPLLIVTAVTRAIPLCLSIYLQGLGGVPAMIEHSRRLRDAYLRWGRDGLGFGAYLFYRPGPRLR